MQIKISFVSQRDIILPVSYNSTLQGFIYKNIDKELADFLHSEGYIKDGRTFKLFTFSRILNRGKIQGDKFNFGKEIQFIVSSTLENFCKSIANTMLQSERLYLGANNITIDGIEIINNKVEKDEAVFSTLSPIVAYSTFIKGDGNKYTCYFQPHERDFKRIVSENLIRKYNALYDEDLAFQDGIEIEAMGSTKMNIVYYKNFLIKGATGKFKVKGDKKLLQMAVNVGLGSKNSQGFGCVELVTLWLDRLKI